MSDQTLCLDCGIDAWDFLENGRRVHEDFYLVDEIWEQVCPENEILCLGCAEKRLGRVLMRSDFKSDGMQGQREYWDRLGAPMSDRMANRLGHAQNPSKPRAKPLKATFEPF